MTERELDNQGQLSPVQMADLVSLQIVKLLFDTVDQIAIESGTSTELVVESIIRNLNLVMTERLLRGRSS